MNASGVDRWVEHSAFCASNRREASAESAGNLRSRQHSDVIAPSAGRGMSRHARACHVVPLCVRPLATTASQWGWTIRLAA